MHPTTKTNSPLYKIADMYPEGTKNNEGLNVPKGAVINIERMVISLAKVSSQSLRDTCTSGRVDLWRSSSDNLFHKRVVLGKL